MVNIQSENTESNFSYVIPWYTHVTTVECVFAKWILLKSLH